MSANTSSSNSMSFKNSKSDLTIKKPGTRFQLIDPDGNTRYVESPVVCIVNNNFKSLYKVENRLRDKIERKGSQNDIARIKETFQKLNFQICDQLYNKNKELILKTIESTGQYKNKDKELVNPDVFVLFIMSHGGEDGAIYTDYLSNGTRAKKGFTAFRWDQFEEYSTEQIFCAVRNNPFLKDSLKIIILQACRGKFSEIYLQRNGNTQSAQQITHQVSPNSCRCPILSTPANSIVLYSTVEGTISYRLTKFGTKLVQPLCNVIENAEHGQSLLQLITRTQGLICKEAIHFAAGQTPEILYNATDQLVVEKLSVSKGQLVGVTRNNGSDYYDWSDKGNTKGYAALIKLDQSFNELELKKAIETNLEIDLNLLPEDEDVTDTKLSEAFENIQIQSKEAAYLLVIVAGKLVSSTKGKVKEVCISSKPKPTPISALIRKFVGTNNVDMLGKPKFFIFIDDKKNTKKTKLPQIRSFSQNMPDGTPWSAPNHSYNLTFICVGDADLKILMEHLSSSELRKGGCSLQSQLAECVRRCNAGKSHPSNQMHTLFTSTIPTLVNFPKAKNAYVAPSIRTSEDSVWNIQKSGWSPLVESFLHKVPETVGTTVLLPPEAWLLVGPAGQGKSRFTFEFARVLGKECKVVRATLRKHCNFLNECATAQRDVDFEYFLDGGGGAVGGDEVSTVNGGSANGVGDFDGEENLVFLFDGFEKVCSIFFSVLEKLFQRIVAARHSLFVTTRPCGLAKSKQLDVPFKEFHLNLFSAERQIQMLENHRAILTSEAKLQWEKIDDVFLGDFFIGNPLHLSKVLDKNCDDASIVRIFEAFDAILDTYVERALVKFESIGKDSAMLGTRIRMRRELLIVTAAHLQNFDYTNFDLSANRRQKINNVGIISISESGRHEYHFGAFRDFLLSLYFFHGLRGVKKSEQIFKDALMQINSGEDFPHYPKFFEELNFLTDYQKRKFGSTINLAMIET